MTRDKERCHVHAVVSSELGKKQNGVVDICSGTLTFIGSHLFQSENAFQFGAMMEKCIGTWSEILTQWERDDDDDLGSLSVQL